MGFSGRCSFSLEIMKQIPVPFEQPLLFFPSFSLFLVYYHQPDMSSEKFSIFRAGDPLKKHPFTHYFVSYGDQTAFSHLPLELV